MPASTIGIVSIGQEPAFFAGRYYREILTVASQEVVSHGCYIRPVSLAHGQVERPDEARALLRTYDVDAALLVAPNEVVLGALPAIAEELPVIMISAPHLDTPYSYVNSDNYGALRQIVQHLFDLGRRRVKLLQPHGVLTGDYWERARGYADAVAELGLAELAGSIPHPIDDAVVDGQVLAGAPDALIAPSDNDALALLSRLQRRRLRVPEDIALVGFDDEDFAAETFPALTTVNQPLAEMARRATTYLLGCLAGAERAVYQDVLPNRLVVRESSGA
jgi:LacI family transcriptional regulator